MWAVRQGGRTFVRHLALHPSPPNCHLSLVPLPAPLPWAQLESMITSSAKYQALLTDTERKLAQAAAAADEARDTVRQRREGGMRGQLATCDSVLGRRARPAPRSDARGAAFGARPR